MDTNNISAITALVAVIIGPIISWYIAKRQIIASTVTISRQQWINTLRDAIADFSERRLIRNSMFLCNSEFESKESFSRSKPIKSETISAGFKLRGVSKVCALRIVT